MGTKYLCTGRVKIVKNTKNFTDTIRLTSLASSVLWHCFKFEKLGYKQRAEIVDVASVDSSCGVACLPEEVQRHVLAQVFEGPYKVGYLNFVTIFVILKPSYL